MKVWAYGDSFVAGDQDIPEINNALESIMEYNRYNVSFVSHLARQLSVDLINRGISGCSNFVQLDKLFLDAPSIKKDDIVLFGLTTAWRDRVTMPYTCPEYLKDIRGPALIHRELVSGKHDLKKIATIDLFYVLSVIEKIELLFNIKVIKFNLFHDALSEASEFDKTLFKFENFIGLDILTDNWGNKINRIADHSKWKPPVEYKHLFTQNSHPNIEGHKKIAVWLENELKKMQDI